MSEIVNLSEYRQWLSDLKQQIKIGQIKAVLSVNSQMIMLYWDLGRQITEKQKTAKWGSGLIEQLSKDLSKAFPEMKGFSYDNLRFAKRFFLFYAPISEQVVPKLQQVDNVMNVKSEQLVPILETQIHPQVEGELKTNKMLFIPWGHHILILKKIKDINQALFYISKTIENNWSRAVLEYQIETDLYSNQGKAITNFSLTLPEPQGDLANDMMKGIMISVFYDCPKK